MRLGEFFIAVCMGLIAASAGVSLYAGLGFSAGEAMLVAAALLCAMALYSFVSKRIGAGAAISVQLRDMARGNADLARQVGELGRRLAAMEGKVEASADRARAATDPLAAELGELGALLKQVADSVAQHEIALATAPGGMTASTPVAALPVAEAAATPTVVTLSNDNREVRRSDLLPAIRSAVEANRVDLYLQPIVNLPQRKVRYYEAMSRLRTETGDVLQAADFIREAEADNLMPKIDNLVIFRCVQVVRRLLLKNRDIGLFCNLSGATLTDAALFQQLLDFLEANRAIAPSLILEFTHAALRAAGPMENESLAALAECGYRFSLDNLQDLRLEPKELASRGFRFVKVPGHLLLNRGDANADIHPADLSDLLGRFGIDLVAEKIESEGMVVDLLDYDVRFGQGFLFSPPRPVRAEALQGLADRTDIVAREVAPPAPQAAPRPVHEDVVAIGSESESRMSGIARLARRI